MGTKISTEMIERVVDVLQGGFTGGAFNWVELPPVFAENMARAIIKTMREPTKEMIERGNYTIDDGVSNERG